MTWAKHQPKHGDFILTCPHADEADKICWYALNVDDAGVPQPAKVRRPDGSVGEFTWLCCCDQCSRVYGTKFSEKKKMQMMIGGERRWTGNEPVIPADSSN